MSGLIPVLERSVLFYAHSICVKCLSLFIVSKKPSAGKLVFNSVSRTGHSSTLVSGRTGLWHLWSLDQLLDYNPRPSFGFSDDQFALVHWILAIILVSEEISASSVPLLDATSHSSSSSHAIQNAFVSCCAPCIRLDDPSETTITFDTVMVKLASCIVKGLCFLLWACRPQSRLGPGTTNPYPYVE